MIGFNCYYVVDNLIIVRANLDPLLLSFAFSENYFLLRNYEEKNTFFSLKSSFAHFSASRGDYFSLKVYFSQRINFFGSQNLQSRFSVFNWQHHILGINTNCSKKERWYFLANYLTNFANNILACHPSRNVVTNLFAPFVFGHRLIEANYLRASPAAPRDSFVYFAIPSIDIDRCWRPAKCIHLRSFRYQKWTRNKKIKRSKRPTSFTKGSYCSFV